MCKVLITVMIALMPSMLWAQNYWQQKVDYKINVTLDDKKHSLVANITMNYTNNSPETLSFIWIHIWPNAYKNENTALYKQLVSLDKYSKLGNINGKGFIDGLAFKINGVLAKTEEHSQNIDIIKLILPTPLAPGASVEIKTPFTVKLPDYFSRMGHNGNYYMITQWYPKPAVYDAKGWHAFPYLDQGEFYSEYGNFDVSITLPSKYIVAATGELQTQAELNEYKKTGAANRKLFDEAIAKGNNDEAAIASLVKKIKPAKVTIGVQPTKTLRFTQNNVHDFAWFASKDFVVQYLPFQLPSGKAVDAFTFHYPDHCAQWYNSSNFCKEAVKYYSETIGEYEYSTVKALEGPKNQSSGGMEYPTVTLITSPEADQKTLDGVITHEVGHNWFYSMLGSNERDYPFMDEGMNTYYELRYEAIKYRSCSMAGPLPAEFTKLSETELSDRIYSFFNSQAPGENPINTPAIKFTTNQDYGLVAYIKSAVWMHLMEKKAGRTVLDDAMKAYFAAWKNKHPQLTDFKSVLTEKLKDYNVEDWLGLLDKKGRLSFN